MSEIIIYLIVAVWPVPQLLCNYSLKGLLTDYPYCTIVVSPTLVLEPFMAQMANFLVKDDAATPKEWTLQPITDTPIPFWRGSDASIPLDGQPRLTMSTEKLKSGGYKVTAKLEVPTMETLGASGTSAGYVAPPKVAYVTTAIFTVFCDKRSTIADRMNCVRMAVAVLQGASATTATGTLANSAAGGAWTASTAAGPQLFNSLTLPN